MKVRFLSFIIACVTVLALYGVVHEFRHDDAAGAAQASLTDKGAEGRVLDAAQILGMKRKVADDADNILAMTGADIQQILNQPELVRSDFPTVVWQYRTDSCVLDIYYTASSADVSKTPVAHYEVRSRDAKGRAQVTAKECLSGMVNNGTLVSLLDVSAFMKSGS